MKASRDCIYVLQHFEGLELKRYTDVAGYGTLGIGHKLRPGDNSNPLNWEDVLALFFEHDLPDAEDGVALLTEGHALTQGQFDALVSFAFNEGQDQLRRSSLLSFFLAGDLARAADEFLEWDKAHENGKLIELEGLRRRRLAERALFLGRDYRPFLKG